MRAGITRLEAHVSSSSETPEHPLGAVITWTGNRPALNANTCQVFDGLSVRLPATAVCINSGGFRDYEYSKEKPDDVFRIIMLGDSFTFGWGLELEDTLPKRLEAELNKNNEGRSFQVLNFGIPGMETLEELVFLEDTGLDYHPDMVIFHFLRGDFENQEGFLEFWESRTFDYLKEHPDLTYNEAKSAVL